MSPQYTFNQMLMCTEPPYALISASPPPGVTRLRSSMNQKHIHICCVIFNDHTIPYDILWNICISMDAYTMLLVFVSQDVWLSKAHGTVILPPRGPVVPAIILPPNGSVVSAFEASQPAKPSPAQPGSQPASQPSQPICYIYIYIYIYK